MGCGGDREKGNVALEEKWDYVVSGSEECEQAYCLLGYALEPERFQVRIMLDPFLILLSLVIPHHFTCRLWC